jgi:hypothetical protein
MEIQFTIMYSGISKTWNTLSDIHVFLSEINKPVADGYARFYRTHFEYTLLFWNTSFSFFVLPLNISVVPISQYMLAWYSDLTPSLYWQVTAVVLTSQTLGNVHLFPL